MASFNQQAQPIPVMSSSCYVLTLRENDVIWGSNNLKFKQFIKAYKKARLQAKASIAAADAVREVVRLWGKLSPPGRFLANAQGSPHQQWQEVNDKQAMKIAAYFLLNQNGGELKRQKSGEAMRNSRNSQGADQQPRGSGVAPDLNGSCMGGQSQSRAFGNISRKGQAPDMMPSVEPVPIRPIGSTSVAWDSGQNQHIQSFQEPFKAHFQVHDKDFGDMDFQPLPFQPDSEGHVVDDFEPLEANFNTRFSSIRQNSCTLGPVDVSTNAHFGGVSEQVQVSVNIQIGPGTISDERRRTNDSLLKSSFGDGFPPGQNFQLTTDTTNGYIQISAQSNPIDEAANMMPHGNCPGFVNGSSMMVGNEHQLANESMQGNKFDGRNINQSIHDVGAGGNGERRIALAWNKNEVANSVPCAASLVGSVFDDW